MRRFTYPVLIALVVSACASRGPVATPGPESPCSNQTYVVLKARPIDELSEREYEMLRELERACAEYQIVREREAANRTRATMAKIYTIFAIVGAAAIAVVAGSI